MNISAKKFFKFLAFAPLMIYFFSIHTCIPLIRAFFVGYHKTLIVVYYCCKYPDPRVDHGNWYMPIVVQSVFTIDDELFIHFPPDAKKRNIARLRHSFYSAIFFLRFHHKSRCWDSLFFESFPRDKRVFASPNAHQFPFERSKLYWRLNWNV